MRAVISDLIRERTDGELLRAHLADVIARLEQEPKRCPVCDNELEPDGFCLGSQCRKVRK